jgi:hypothetical protein
LKAALIRLKRWAALRVLATEEIRPLEQPDVNEEDEEED